MAADGTILIDTSIDTDCLQKGFDKVAYVATQAAAAIGTAFTAAASAAITVGLRFTSGLSEVQPIGGAAGADLAALTEKA